MEDFVCSNIGEFFGLELLKLEPGKHIKKYIKNIRDVYEKRMILKKCYWDYNSFDYLLSIFVDTVEGQSKFIRKADCFKVLKTVVKYSLSGQQFPKQINDKIFYLYRRFIFSENEEVVWSMSVLLKDQVLENEQIEWLIANCSENEHVLNRVLRYPKTNKQIEEWANKAIESSEFEGRESEICGILIKDSIPKNLKCQDSKVLAWGIYYSKNNDKLKQDLLIEVADSSNIRSITEICYRLNYPRVISALLAKAEEFIDSGSLRRIC